MVLLIGNCSAHPQIENLTDINVVFSPMEQRVINRVEAHYRGRIVRLYIEGLDKNKRLPKIFILQPIKDLVSSCDSVTKQTNVNFFKKVGMSKWCKQIDKTDADNPFKCFVEDLNCLQEIDPSTVYKELYA